MRLSNTWSGINEARDPRHTVDHGQCDHVDCIAPDALAMEVTMGKRETEIVETVITLLALAPFLVQALWGIPPPDQIIWLLQFVPRS